MLQPRQPRSGRLQASASFDDRATAILAVVRIVAVLGMSFAIAGGIFLLLGGWWLLGLAALAGFVPFFGVMRFMEKRAARE